MSLCPGCRYSEVFKIWECLVREMSNVKGDVKNKIGQEDVMLSWRSGVELFY